MPKSPPFALIYAVARAYWQWIAWAVFAALILRGIAIGASCLLDTSQTCSDWLLYGFLGPLRFQWVAKYKEIVAALIGTAIAVLALRAALGQTKASQIQAAVATIAALKIRMENITTSESLIADAEDTIQLILNNMRHAAENEDAFPLSVMTDSKQSEILQRTAKDLRSWEALELSDEISADFAKSAGYLEIVASHVRQWLSGDNASITTEVLRQSITSIGLINHPAIAMQAELRIADNYLRSSVAQLFQMKKAIQKRIGEQEHLLLS